VARVVIIHNGRKPRAASARAQAVLEGRGFEVETEVTWDACEGAQKTRVALSRGADWVIAAGGDGTVMSVLEAVVEHKATLGLLPLGTANDFGTSLSLQNLDAALLALGSGRVVELDVGICEFTQLNGLRGRGLFTSSAGAGMMARLAELEDTALWTRLKRMLGNAVWPLIATTATLTTPFARARIVAEGRSMARDIAAFELTKLPRVGGIELTPDASSASGILHVWVAEGKTRRALVHTLRHALSGDGRLLRSRHVQYISRDPGTNQLGAHHITSIKLDAEPTLPVHLNGDFVGRTPANFGLLPRGLRVCVPSHLSIQA